MTPINTDHKVAENCFTSATCQADETNGRYMPQMLGITIIFLYSMSTAILTGIIKTQRSEERNCFIKTSVDSKKCQ